MIPKKYRFKNFNFNIFFKLAAKKQNEMFNIWMSENNYSYPRFSVSPSKRIFKTAVARNKIRRQIYEILRLNLKKIRKADYVIVPKKPLSDLTHGILMEKIMELLK